MDTRVAVVGARGIGRHHANWWHLEGAEVCAVLGTGAESLEKTGAMLREMFGFAGRGYTDFATLLEEERPHIVDVCSPPACHAAHVRQALEADCNVLCEKPFVHDTGLSTAALLDEARSLLDLAEAHGLTCSVCTQYSTGARIFRDHWEKHHPGEAIHKYHGHLESPAKGRSADPARVWVDLSPHIISVFTALFPGAEVQWHTLVHRFEGYEAIASFDATTREGRTVGCELYTRNRTAPPNNVRHFRLNGRLFDVEGARDRDGVFHARIATPEGTLEKPDMMRLLIRDFLAGKPTVTKAEILENLRLMLTLLDRATEKPPR